MTRMPPEHPLPLAVGFQSIERDYWRLVPIAADEGDDPQLLAQGRRRTTERFWQGLLLEAEQAVRLAAAVGVARDIVVDYQSLAPGEHGAVFPATETLALCAGPGYALEISHTVDGHLRFSIDTTIYANHKRLRPCVHLVGGELNRFAEDLSAIARKIAAQRANPIQAAHRAAS